MDDLTLLQIARKSLSDRIRDTKNVITVIESTRMDEDLREAILEYRHQMLREELLALHIFDEYIQQELIGRWHSL